MSRTSQAFVILVLFLLGSPGCESDSTTGPEDSGWPLDVRLSPRTDAEAEWAAVWLSGLLAAPETLYQQISSDLGAIRSEFTGEFPALDSVRFRPRWEAQLEVGFDPVIYDEVASGAYRHWDELSRAFQVTAIDTVPRNLGTCSVKLTFGKRLHPGHLISYYLDLTGVTWAGYRILYGVYATVYPWRVDSGRTYLFRNCGEDCVDSEYWYFRVTTEGPEFVGYHHLGAPPEWWEEARRGRDAFGHGGGA